MRHAERCPWQSRLDAIEREHHFMPRRVVKRDGHTEEGRDVLVVPRLKVKRDLLDLPVALDPER